MSEDESHIFAGNRAWVAARPSKHATCPTCGGPVAAPFEPTETVVVDVGEISASCKLPDGYSMSFPKSVIFSNPIAAGVFSDRMNSFERSGKHA